MIANHECFEFQLVRMPIMTPLIGLHSNFSVKTLTLVTFGFQFAKLLLLYYLISKDCINNQQTN